MTCHSCYTKGYLIKVRREKKGGGHFIEYSGVQQYTEYRIDVQGIVL